MPPLEGIRVVNASVNLPADVAGARLTELGAQVTKVEPPADDPVAVVSPALYAELTAGQSVLKLDLKLDADRGRLDALLHDGDLLLTSSRPSALARLGLGWPELGERHPGLVQVAMVGHAAPHQETAGHDLTYQARQGLVGPPSLPRTLVADLAGAERAVSAALALLLARGRDGADRYAEVALEDAAAVLALPWRCGITTPDGPLGGSSPFYRLFEARDGWVALAALERHFQERVVDALGVEATVEAFAAAFATRRADEWEHWADELDIPLAAVR